MTFKQIKNGDKLALLIDGKIDTITAPALLEFIQTKLDGVKELELNLKQVDYVSSAGLRIFLIAQKIMDKQGKMFLSHVCEEILETLELTCFTDFLTII